MDDHFQPNCCIRRQCFGLVILITTHSDLFISKFQFIHEEVISNFCLSFLTVVYCCAVDLIEVICSQHKSSNVPHLDGKIFYLLNESFIFSHSFAKFDWIHWNHLISAMAPATWPAITHRIAAYRDVRVQINPKVSHAMAKNRNHYGKSQVRNKQLSKQTFIAKLKWYRFYNMLQMPHSRFAETVIFYTIQCHW